MFFYKNMASKKLVTLSDDEILQLYDDAAAFVDKYIRSTKAPQVKLAPFNRRTQLGPTHASFVIINGYNLSFNKSIFDELEKQFGVDINNNSPWIDEEMDPDGTCTIYKLNIPIAFHQSAAVSKGGNGKRRTVSKAGVAPTIEWPLVLLLTEVCLSGWMYYRYVMGVLI